MDNGEHVLIILLLLNLVMREVTMIGELRGQFVYFLGSTFAVGCFEWSSVSNLTITSFSVCREAPTKKR